MPLAPAPPPKTEIEVGEDPQLYSIEALNTQNTFIQFDWISGHTGIFTKPDSELTPAGIDKADFLFFGVAGSFVIDKRILRYDYPFEFTDQEEIRQWRILLGHLVDICMDALPCWNDADNNMVSFYGEVPSSQSKLRLDWGVQDAFNTYYIGSVERAVFSEDGEQGFAGFNLFGQGEMNSFYYANLLKFDQSTREELPGKSVGVEYPQFGYREVYSHNIGDVKSRPVFFPNIPVIGMEKSELDEYSAYEFYSTAYEDDDKVFHYLNPFTWLGLAGSIAGVIGGLYACVQTGSVGCFIAWCSAVSFVGEADKMFTKNPEDEPFGTAVSILHQDIGFGLLEGTKRTTVETQGRDNHKSWADEFSGSAEGQVVQGSCFLADTITKPYFDENGFKTLKNVGGTGYGGYSLVKGLVGEEDEGRWHNVTYGMTLVNTYPAIDEMKVVFIDAHIIGDRDGSWKGDGDLYTNTMVGVIGDKGQLPQTRHDGNPLNPIYGEGQGRPERRVELTFADADVMRYPQNIFSDIGVGDGGTLDPPDPVIFHRQYSGNENVTGVYVEISIFDSDVFEDDEVGVVSNFHDFFELWSAVKKCKEDNSFSDGWCKLTIVKSVQPDLYYYQLPDSPNLTGLNSFEGGSTIKYEIWIKPKPQFMS